MKPEQSHKNDIYKDFGEFIKNVRISKGLLQQEVADALGLSQAHFSRFENGERTIDLHLVENICDCLNVTLEDFIMYRYHDEIK